MSERTGLRRRSAGAAALALGIATGVASAAWSAAAESPGTEPSAVFDVTHLPPLLRVPGEASTLAYDVHCLAKGEEDVEAGCDAIGTAYVRRVGDEEFEAFPLRNGLAEGRSSLRMSVPDRLGTGRRGFEYYAVLEAPGLDRRIVLPAGGAAAPHVSLPLSDPTQVNLGRHAFGSKRRAATRVAFAGWGDGPGQVGLEAGRNLDPIGGSAFDVDGRGDVVLLDQVHRRLLRWTKDGAARSSAPVSVNGTIADLALADDGSLFVLETTSPPGRNPMIRRFDDGGRELEAIESAERTPAQIHVDDHGAAVLARPSHQWMPVLVDGAPATARRQRELGRSGRRVGTGGELVVFRRANEIRLAIVTGSAVTRSWRLTSSTPLAEVQLADVWGRRLVVVTKVYEEGADEFAVLVLDHKGLVSRFSVDSADWAETAPLARFERVGSALYRLGSSPAGVFVDRFDLEEVR